MATRKITLIVVAAVLIFVVGAYSVGHIGGWLRLGVEATAPDTTAPARDPAAVRIVALSSGPQSVELNDKQLASVMVETVGEHVFPVERVAVGSIDFNEELTVQVFTPYQGKIMDLFAKVGDEV